VKIFLKAIQTDSLFCAYICGKNLTKRMKTPLAQGCPITVQFTTSAPLPSDSDIHVWLFTDKNNAVKFEPEDVTEEDGVYSVTATSQQTKDFCGDLYISVLIVVGGDEAIQPNETASTGITITKSPISSLIEID